MSIKRIGIIVIGILVCALSFTYVLFQQGSRESNDKETEIEEVITVLCCYEIKEHREILLELAQEFEKNHPGSQVQIEFIDNENLKREVCLRAEDRKNLDIIICSSLEMPGLMDMGILKDITPFVNEKMREKIIYKDMWKSAMDDGKYYGIPFLCSPWVLFSNMDYLEKMGQNPPENWDELFEVCKNTDRGGFYGLSLGVRRSGDAAALFNCIMRACGGNYYTLDSEYGLRILEILDTLKRWNYVDKNVVNTTPKDAAKIFAEGHAAMFIAPLSINTWLKNCNMEIAYSITELPGDIKPSCLLMGDNIGLIKTADDMAVDFVDYLYSPETRIRVLKGTDTLPFLLGEEESIKLEGDIKRLNNRFQGQGSVPESYNSWFEISNILARCVQDIFAKRNINIEEYMVRLQDEIRVAVMNN